MCALGKTGSATRWHVDVSANARCSEYSNERGVGTIFAVQGPNPRNYCSIPLRKILQSDCAIKISFSPWMVQSPHRALHIVYMQKWTNETMKSQERPLKHTREDFIQSASHTIRRIRVSLRKIYSVCGLRPNGKRIRAKVKNVTVAVSSRSVFAKDFRREALVHSMLHLHMHALSVWLCAVLAVCTSVRINRDIFADVVNERLERIFSLWECAGINAKRKRPRTSTVHAQCWATIERKSKYEHCMTCTWADSKSKAWHCKCTLID